MWGRIENEDDNEVSDMIKKDHARSRFSWASEWHQAAQWAKKNRSLEHARELEATLNPSPSDRHRALVWSLDTDLKLGHEHLSHTEEAEVIVLGGNRQSQPIYSAGWAVAHAVPMNELEELPEAIGANFEKILPVQYHEAIVFQWFREVERFFNEQVLPNAEKESFEISFEKTRLNKPRLFRAPVADDESPPEAVEPIEDPLYETAQLIILKVPIQTTPIEINDIFKRLSRSSSEWPQSLGLKNPEELYEEKHLNDHRKKAFLWDYCPTLMVPLFARTIRWCLFKEWYLKDMKSSYFREDVVQTRLIFDKKSLAKTFEIGEQSKAWFEKWSLSESIKVPNSGDAEVSKNGSHSHQSLNSERSSKDETLANGLKRKGHSL